MSYTCKNCQGLVLEGEEKRQAWGYGGKYCTCFRPCEFDITPPPINWNPMKDYIVPQQPSVVTLDDIRRVVREELERAGVGKPDAQS